MRVLALTKYDTLAASTRQRFIQYKPTLEDAGISVSFSPLFDNRYLQRLASGRTRSLTSVVASYIRRAARLASANAYDALWIHCELFPYLPVEWIGAAFRPPIVFDFDDAIFEVHALQHRPLLRRLLARKLDPLLMRAAVCCCGNAYLRAYAERFCPETIILPTVVDTEIYVPAPVATSDGPPVIGWIGSPTTWENVRPLLPLLRQLCESSQIRFRAIGAGPAAERDRFPGMEPVDWSEATEVAELQRMDVGIMPLLDLPFQRGKSGYKLVQYMACGLPVIATPVGVNAEMVEEGVNGFLAADVSDWKRAIESLCGAPALRRRMGEEGRKRAVRDFSLAAYAPRLAQVFKEAVDGMPSTE